MQVFTARTCETFDIDYLCQDLARQVNENVTFGQRTMGIAVCDSTIDDRAVMKKLSEIFSFDIYGCTALAFIRMHSAEDITVSFMVITGNEELVGSMALSEPLTADNREEAIRDTYRLARQRLGEDPKVIITLQPYSLDITPDCTTEVLDEISGHCPVYGAVSSNDLETNESGVFVNGVMYTDRLLINLLGGGIRPLFACAMPGFDMPENHVVITKAQRHIVHKVGEETFLDYMRKSGLAVTENQELASFIAIYASSPVVVYEKGRFAETKKLRNIIDIDFATGAVTFSGEMPEGYELGICVLRREEIEQSSAACFEEMARKIEANTTENYRYSTLFSTVCGGRYLVMASDTSVDGEFLTQTPVLKDLASCGFYAMGEICPVPTGDGKIENRSLHSSITLMAL